MQVIFVITVPEISHFSTVIEFNIKVEEKHDLYSESYRSIIANILTYSTFL